MTDAIVKIYVELVRAGRRTLEQVPETVRTQVEQALGAE